MRRKWRRRRSRTRLHGVHNWGELALAAHAAYLQHLASAPIADTLEAGGAFAVATGVLSNVENGIVGSRLRPSEADDAIRALIDWLVERRLPASWICPQAPQPSDLPARLVRAGCRAENNGIDMGAELQALPKPPPPPGGIELVRVGEERMLDLWLDVAESCGWIDEPGDRERRRLQIRSLELDHNEPLRRLIALRGERPVGMATGFVAERVLLLHDVAVVAHEQRRGIGRALTLGLAHWARAVGCEVAVLAPSPDGAKLAQSLGFQTAPTPPDRWFYLPPRPASR
jgi:GNAT superfamily N-acetyltransferase